jgi:RimK-like ATP-grasp domain
VTVRLTAPIGILDEHPEWSARLLAELQHRRLPFEKIDHSSHAFDPRDRAHHYSVIVNRTSPSSHRRGHGGVLFYAEALLAYWEARGIPVINPVAAFRFEKSKALQAGLFERVGVRYPRTLVVNHRDQVLKASGELRFPILVKPNIGGSGALIERFDSRADLEAHVDALDFGPDGTALVQEYVESEDGAIVRVEVMDDRYLYAIRIVRAATDFNLCPADICQQPAAPSADLGACPVEVKPGLSVTRYDPPGDVIDQVRGLARAASIDIGGIEYLVGRADGRVYYYDVNATSNFVANAPAVLGFDPIPIFADYIVRRASGESR